LRIINVTTKQFSRKVIISDSKEYYFIHSWANYYIFKQGELLYF